MLNITIDETAAKPAQQRAYETGDTAATGTLELPFEDTADGLGYAFARISGGARALHGKITTDGAGNATAAGGGGGYTPTTSSPFVRVTFAVPKANANYTVTCGMRRPAAAASVAYDDPTTTKVDFYFYDAAAAPIDAFGTAVEFGFSILDDE